MASEHDFDGVMSEQEQENHLAKLVLEERKAQKKLACLTSKARQTNSGHSAIIPSHIG